MVDEYPVSLLRGRKSANISTIWFACGGCSHVYQSARD